MLTLQVNMHIIIGNIIDGRKNFSAVVDAYAKTHKPNMHFIVKATCSHPVHSNSPFLTMINDMLDDEAMNQLHDRCHCYASCSFSEGIGMGAVEAAMRDKPVTITEHGGAKEHVNTPYLVPCGRRNVGFEDFLFSKDFMWGDPNLVKLEEFMLDACEKRLTYMNHDHTRNTTDGEIISKSIHAACN